MPDEFSDNQRKMRDELVQLKQREQADAYDKALAAAQKNLANERETDLAQLVDRANKAQGEPDERDPDKTVSHWARANAAAENILNKEITSINDWRATMSSTLNMCISLNKAIAGSVYLLYAKEVAPGIHDVYNKVLDRITGEPKPNFQPDMTLPSLYDNVTMDNNNVLQIAPLGRSDNVVNEPGHRNLNQYFADGVKIWLNRCGWSEDPNMPNVFRDENGVQLDQATFDTLKNDPDHGLRALLNEGSDLVFSEPPPSPRI